VRVAVDGRLAFEAARDLKRAVARAVDLGCSKVIIDLGGVTEIDPLGMGAILETDAVCCAAGRALEVVAPAGDAGRLIRLLGGGGRLTFATLDASA
jgi:anti-anti-sigma regulatory factor